MRAQHERPVHNRRAPTPRRRSLRVYPWLLCLCALCVGAALIQAGRHCFDGAGFLAVADIRICGCSHIPPARVLEMISIRKGQNIFTIDLIAEAAVWSATPGSTARSSSAPCQTLLMFRS